MRSSNIVHRLLSSIPVARLSLAGLMAFAVTACNKDEPSDWTLVLQTDKVALTEDGSDTATITVSLLDQNFNPPSLGAEVRLLAVPGGNVNDSSLPTATSPTDALGYATFNVACVDSNPLTIQAQFDGATGILRPPPGATASIQCLPAPEGDWTIAITAEPRRIAPGGSSSVRIVALDGDGDPVNTSPAVRMQITSGPLTFARGGTELLRTVDTSGRFDATIIAPATAEDATGTICASFSDARFGNTPACVGVVISSAQISEPACVVAYGAGRVPADNSTVTTATFSLTDAVGTPLQNATINANIAAGTFLTDATGTPVGPTLTATTNNSGDAIAYIRSPAVPGSAALTASATFTQEGTEQTIPCVSRDNLTFFGPPQCSFGGMEPPILGVQQSGLDEQGKITFCFVQSDGSAIGANRRVDFGFDLELVDARLAASSALTDENGCASVYLTAGTQAGTALVRATLDFGSLDSTCVSSPLLFRGGLPVGHDFALRCETESASVLIRSAGDQVFTDCSIECWTYLRDQWGNPVNRPDVNVFFATEQGIITSVATPDEAGRVSARFQPNGALPSDVTPLSNEPRIISALGEVRNPRDMWVTVIAFTTGTEGFYDDNGNGVRDDGEVWIDLSEPFVDNNDNDAYDPGVPNYERFFDVRSESRDFNGEWDGPNGEFDAVTTIWTRTAIRLTDSPIFGQIADYGFVRDTTAARLSPPVFSYFGVPLFGGGLDAYIGDIPIIATPATPPIVVNRYGFVGVDQFLNPISQQTNAITIAIADGCGDITAESDVSALPFFFSQAKRGYTLAGARSESNPDYYLWETVIDFYGAALANSTFAGTQFQLLAPPIPFSVIAPEGAAGNSCEVSANVSTFEAVSCADVSVEESIRALMTVVR